MSLPKTTPDKILDSTDLECPGYKNTNTPWWDASQIYGSDEQETQTLRHKDRHGKLHLKKPNMTNGGAVLPPDHEHIGSFPGGPETGFNDNWWIGMEMLHTLFALEHNSLCDMFREKHPDWRG